MKKTNKYLKGHFVSKTDIGCVRVTNEDRAISLVNAKGDVLLCVCDGMGGHNKGDYASQLAIDVVSSLFMSKSKFLLNIQIRIWLSSLVRKVNSQIFNEAQTNPKYKDMGTTMVLAFIHKETIHFINIGDSRAYIVLFDSMKKVTDDQTYVDYLYNTGKISEEEKQTSPQRHILMNALGTFPSVSYTYKKLQYLRNSIFLCSDGLYNNISEKEIHNVLLGKERLDQKVDTLFSIAKSNGGSDNMAISYWEPTRND